MKLETDRLLLVSLSLEQLKLIPNYIDKLEHELKCKEINLLLSCTPLKAFNLKVEKMQNIEPSLHPWFTYWLITHKTSNFALGFAGFKGIPNEKGEVEIGYSVSPNFRKRGIASKVVTILKSWAFSNTECQAITATNVLNTNIASQKVLEKCGFKLISKNESTSNWKLFK